VAGIPLGLQLYTVREYLKADFKGTLRAVADMGYQAIEMGGDLGGLEPEELAALLRSLGLAAAGLHAPTGDIIDTKSRAYAYAKALGCPYLSVSRCDDVQKDWYGVIEELKEAGSSAKSKGLTFTPRSSPRSKAGTRSTYSSTARTRRPSSASSTPFGSRGAARIRHRTSASSLAASRRYT
jgi:sugar phosphate isomerase/epimerase